MSDLCSTYWYTYLGFMNNKLPYSCMGGSSDTKHHIYTNQTTNEGVLCKEIIQGDHIPKH